MTSGYNAGSGVRILYRNPETAAFHLLPIGSRRPRVLYKKNHSMKGGKCHYVHEKETVVCRPDRAYDPEHGCFRLCNSGIKPYKT